MNNKTLIVNYFGMGIGGVEKNNCNLMRYCADNGIKVIWFTDKIALENAAQPGIADNPKIEKVIFAGGRRKFFVKAPELILPADEDVVMISFTPEDYVWAEQFRFKFHCKTFYHHLILMNFFGWLTFPEDEFKTAFLSKKRAKLSCELAHKLDDNDNIRAFDIKQLKAFKERYNLNIELSVKKILKGYNDAVPVSQQELMSKARKRQSEFTIVTCARFQFPHKGYLIGLLKVFKEFNQKHPNSKLVIIGDGEKETFLEYYNQLPEQTKQNIILRGTVPFSVLTDEYKKGSLIIGLAGAISTAASIGMPSLVVRHDTLECETYGFYQDAKSTLNSDAGFEIMPYIEKVYNCSDKEYVALGEQARVKSLERRIIEPDYILKETNKSSLPTVSKADMRKNKMWAVISILKKYFKFL